MINIDIQAFLKQFNKEYNFLYNSDSYVAGYDEAVTAFDEFLATPNGNRLVREFVKYRQDFISSDREAAAFMFALSTFEDGECVPLT